MGLLDFFFGKKESAKDSKEDLEKEKKARKKAEDDRKRAEAERRRIEADKALMEALLKERTDQLKYYMEKQAEEAKKTQEYIRLIADRTNATDLKGQETGDKKHLEELETKNKELESLLKKKQVDLSQDFYAKQAELEEDLTRRRSEMRTAIEDLKEKQAQIVVSKGYKSPQAQMLEEEILEKEEEIRGMREGIASVKGEASLMEKQLIDLEKKRTEMRGLESELGAEMERIKQLRRKKRNEFLARLGNLTFDNFVVGKSNKFAYEVCQSVAKAPADAYNPLYIHGAVGLGKTHMLSAMGNFIMANDPEAVVTYASSETFTNDLLEAVEKNKLEEFRERYRSVDVLLVDDIQFIGKQETTQEEFFHTFNALHNANKQIVIASDRPPKDIATLEKRLRSRFEGGLITEIKVPDRETIVKIIKMKAAKDKVTIPKDVEEFLAKEITSNVRTLIGALNKITAYSVLNKKTISLDMAQEVLSDVLEEEGKITELEKLE